MDFSNFELCCAEYLTKQYGHRDINFEVSGGTDSTAPDIIVKKGNQVICNIEVKEPCAQCGQFVAFPDEVSRKFKYSELNHPKKASKESLAILAAMEKDFDKHKEPSTKELGLDKELYYNRIVDYYTNYKDSRFFITRESVDKGPFIIFPVSRFRDYFDVSACYRRKASGSHNPNKKELAALPTILTNKYVSGYTVLPTGKYTNVLMNNVCSPCFIVEGVYRMQFKQISGKLYRMTVLSTTNNANVIFTITLKNKQMKDDLLAFEKIL